MSRSTAGEEHLIIGAGLIPETSFLLDGVLRVDIHCSLQGKRVCAVFMQYDTYWLLFCYLSMIRYGNFFTISVLVFVCVCARVHVFSPSTEDGNRSSFRNIVFWFI
jgi:hypothetical protein